MLDSHSNNLRSLEECHRRWWWRCRCSILFDFAVFRRGHSICFRVVAETATYKRGAGAERGRFAQKNKYTVRAVVRLFRFYYPACYVNPIGFVLVTTNNYLLPFFTMRGGFGDDSFGVSTAKFNCILSCLFLMGMRAAVRTFIFCRSYDSWSDEHFYAFPCCSLRFTMQSGGDWLVDGVECCLWAWGNIYNTMSCRLYD